MRQSIFPKLSPRPKATFIRKIIFATANANMFPIIFLHKKHFRCVTPFMCITQIATTEIVFYVRINLHFEFTCRKINLTCTTNKKKITLLKKPKYGKK